MDNEKKTQNSEIESSHKYTIGSLNPNLPSIRDSVQMQKITDAMSPITRSVLDKNIAILVSSKFDVMLEYQKRWDAIIEKTLKFAQFAVDDYIEKGLEKLQRTFEIFEKYNYSIFENLSKTLSQFGSRLQGLERTYQIALLDARWFPHAIHNASVELLENVVEVLDTTRQGSANRTKRLDRVFFAFYNKKTLDDLKKHWRNNSDTPPHNKKIATQAINAYHRKEYALTISALMTLWEGIIATKLGKEGDYRVSRRTRENIATLNEENDVSDIVTQFCQEYIFYDCNSPEQVIDDVPGRHAIAHAWYAKYPTRKTALNAILFTDFLFELNSKVTLEEN